MDMDEALPFPSQEAMEDWLRRNRRAPARPEELRLPIPVADVEERPTPPKSKDFIVIDLS